MENRHQQATSIAVIGAGIIGVCSAIELQKRGFQVTLVEKKHPAAGASSGNCGLLAIGEVVPFAKPDSFRKIPGWLLDPKGPLVIRPSYVHKLIPWFYRFLMAAKPSRVHEISRGLAALTEQSTDAYLQLLEEAGIKDMLQPYENILVYDNEDDFEKDRFTWELKESLGFGFERLSPEALRALEPDIADDFACGVKLSGWYYFADPNRLVQELVDHFRANGGELITGAVETLHCDSGQVSALTIDGYGELKADGFVIAAGAWSGRLTAGLGDRVPVEALAGYATTVADPGINVRHPIIYANGGFVVTPMEKGLHIAGTSEMGGLHESPNYGRAKIIANKAKRIFPGLSNVEGNEWMGYRSFMPDTLPVIDFATQYSNVVYAFGHGQIGLTTGAVTGKLVAEMLAGEAPSVDLSPYAVSRF